MEAAGGILRFLWGESLCMERLLALTDGELKPSLDRLGIEIGLLDSPGATVDLGMGLTSPPVEEKWKVYIFFGQTIANHIDLENYWYLMHCFAAETLKIIS